MEEQGPWGKYDHTKIDCMCPDCHSERMIYCALMGEGHTENHYSEYCPNFLGANDEDED